MTDFDWGSLILGLLTGAATSALYFLGLAYVMRLALKSARPAAVLFLSSTARIALLLAVGWLVAQSGVWALMGFALAFLVVRFIAIRIARLTTDNGDT